MEWVGWIDGWILWAVLIGAGSETIETLPRQRLYRLQAIPFPRHFAHSYKPRIRPISTPPPPCGAATDADIQIQIQTALGSRCGCGCRCRYTYIRMHIHTHTYVSGVGGGDGDGDGGGIRFWYIEHIYASTVCIRHVSAAQLLVSFPQSHFLLSLFRDKLSPI